MSKLNFNFRNDETDNLVEFDGVDKCCLGVFIIIFLVALLIGWGGIYGPGV